MKAIDWIAILGALAWTPHLLSVFRGWFLKSRVRIITQRHVELGFTTYGHIFNLRLAFAVENKDVVVSDLKVRLKHESGEERLFEWQGITQNVGKMTLPDAGVLPYDKEQTVLAIKLNEKDIEERFIKFQEPSFINSQRQYLEKAAKKMAYLKSEKKFEANNFLREPEMIEIYNFNKRAFSWKHGKYIATIELNSPEKFVVFDNVREFYLTPMDVEALELNKNSIEADYKRMIAGSEDDDKGPVWEWRSPVLLKN